MKQPVQRIPESAMKFVLPLPPSINRTYRSAYRPNLGRNVFFMTKSAKEWKKEANFLLKKPGRKLITGQVEVFVTWYLKRDRDVDGGLKLVLDALTGTVFEDDRQVVALHAFKEKDPMPSCEVQVFEV